MEGAGSLCLSVTERAYTMKHVIAILLGLAIFGVSERSTPALAEDPQAAQQTVPAFYNWLEKYQHPTLRPGPQNPSQQVSITPTRTENLESQQNANTVETPSLPIEPPALLVGGATETAEPGEGLGCFYHRAYYSHLPLFKNGTYTLPGSLDVAEPYQKPSRSVFAPSAAPPR